jgi:hypothetical protein
MHYFAAVDRALLCCINAYGWHALRWQRLLLNIQTFRVGILHAV